MPYIRLVQTVVKDRMTKKTRKQWAERAVEAVNRSVSRCQLHNLAQCDRYLSHAQTCVTHIARWDIRQQEQRDS